jgi:hypothetical protein
MPHHQAAAVVAQPAADAFALFVFVEQVVDRHAASGLSVVVQGDADCARARTSHHRVDLLRGPASVADRRQRAVGGYL